MTMNWDAIGAVGEIVGALAVVISIVYLALQIRQNSSLVRSSGYQTAVQTANHFLEGLSSNPETLKVFQAAQESYADLSEDDQVLARTLFLQLFLMYESLFYQYQDGVVAPDIWEGRRKMMFNFLSMPGVAVWWEDWNAIFAGRFLAYISENKDKPPDVQIRI